MLRDVPSGLPWRQPRVGHHGRKVIVAEEPTPAPTPDKAGR
jgi:hypothetical protein